MSTSHFTLPGGLVTQWLRMEQFESRPAENMSTYRPEASTGMDAVSDVRDSDTRGDWNLD